MELDENIINEINNLRLAYEREEKLADYLFIKEVLDIIEATPLFKPVLSYEIFNGFGIMANSGGGRVSINSEKVIDRTKSEIKFWGNQLRDYEILPTRNMYVLAIVLHEVTHAWQDSGLSEFEEVNRLYADLDAATFSGIARLVYLLRGKRIISSERHANLCAYKTLAKIYDEESSMGRIARFYYLDLLLHLYKKSCPIKKDLNAFGLKDDYNLDGIPFLVLLEHGFNVEREKIEYLNFLHEKYINFESNFEDLTKEIRRL